MLVLDTFRIKDRGLVFTALLDCPCPSMGTRLIRPADGQVWTVAGVERSNRLPVQGELAGILVSSGPEPQVGDDIERDADQEGA